MLKQKLKPQTPSSQNERMGSDILPQKISTHTDSCIYVKKMIALAISNITYLRGLLRNDCFVDRLFDDLPVKILKNASDDSDTLKNISNWIRGAYDAIDKKYLKSIVLGIFDDPNNPNLVLESYKFEVTYHGNETTLTMNINNSKSISVKAKMNSLRMLRALQVATSTLDNLPKEPYITIKLYYYDDVTPVDYEPPFFQPATQKEFNYYGNKYKIELGRLNSHWHEMKFELNVSEKMMNEIDDYENITINNKNKKQVLNTEEQNKDINKNDLVSPNQSLFSNNSKYNMNELKDALNVSNKENHLKNTNLDKSYKSAKNNEIEDKDDGYEEEEQIFEQTKKSNSKLNDSKSSSKKLDSLNNEKKINCPCQMTDDIDRIIQCESCKSWQHAICFKLFDKMNTNGLKHFCHKCYTKDKGALLDKSFLNLNEIESKELCLIRRCLYDFLKAKKISKLDLSKKYFNKDKFENQDENYSNWMVKRLISEGFIKCINTKNQEYSIQNVEDALKVYFETDQFKITETPPIDQRVPLEIDDYNDDGIISDLNIDTNKNETVDLKLKLKQDSTINQTINSLDNTKKPTKKKCSDSILEYGHKAKKAKKVSESITKSKIKK